MDARSTVKEYYDALRAGDPLAPYFAEEHDGDDAFVKFGISERLVGSGQIQTGLRTQTETTAEWTVTSHALRVSERGTHAWFSDTVSMGWINTESGERHEFDTRWSGTLTKSSNGWQFVGMHVSTADEL
ncbi:nuclear transport factor 2 family protein [Halorubrum ezzemoulense]|uniref:nuclear transport factor 2 family protein n=1 Tax=Halorubrum ezzemoulense TaxID=337243 RepID=UPI0023309804|nr:nuclear transport factor 2 family protein [Halorubrum ezzemoulense]MDB2239419.1 nuclear transport factor 2 family protein [Halorubrum ezzemoulense]MDB2249982.1 nuclear transport factor 2 family protein [Halorubrum ezzemoulense]